MSARELKPCPFCGGRAEVKKTLGAYHTHHPWHRVIVSMPRMSQVQNFIVDTPVANDTVTHGNKGDSEMKYDSDVGIFEDFEYCKSSGPELSLEGAIEQYEREYKERGGYMPAIATLLRIYADEMAGKYPDDTNGGYAP